jgi:hypothetical protein
MVKHLKLLTVDEVREKYWDSDYHTGSPINCWEFQSFDGLDENNNVPNVQTVKPNSITPTGLLKHRNIKTGKVEIIDNWLGCKKGGPYKKSDIGKSLPDFYYLGFIYKGSDKITWLQVCSRPLNVISTDCMDEVNVWVLKDP